jgi:tryptophanyl-tRNA synthetase
MYKFREYSMHPSQMSSASFEAALERSRFVEKNIEQHPNKHRVLTGDRPTGNLHIGHYFGSLRNRVKLQNLGVETFIVIADYQVLTDHDIFDKIPTFVYELTLDYLACGLDPFNCRTYIFPHSYVRALNQLLLPFLNLVSNSELSRNPTVHEEITASGLSHVNAGMYVYPVHQAADILFCKSTVVPVGKDQLPHIEQTRIIARRFNNRYKTNVFQEPAALLSETPLILGLDGGQKMSKSRNNSIAIKATADETQRMIKTAKTDSTRLITYDPDNRPEVANLLRLASLCLNVAPGKIAEEIGDAGALKLKNLVTEALNEHFKPIRQRREELEKDRDQLQLVLKQGVAQANEVAEVTFEEVRKAMNMVLW